jgi:hypothetical protein
LKNCLSEIIYFSAYNLKLILKDLEKWKIENNEKKNWKIILNSFHEKMGFNVKVFYIENGEIKLAKELFDFENDSDKNIFLLK